MEHRPEVNAAEKREVGCDASMRSVRRRDAQDPPKEHAPADDSSEFWAELGKLRDIICTYTVAVYKPLLLCHFASVPTGGIVTRFDCTCTFIPMQLVLFLCINAISFIPTQLKGLCHKLVCN